MDQYNRPLEIYEVESDLTKALSMKPFNLSKLIDKVPHVKHKIGIRIIQPFADKPKEDAWRLFARNTYILFLMKWRQLMDLGIAIMFLWAGGQFLEV